MKLFSLFLLSSIFFALKPEEKTFPLPDFDNVPYIYNPETNDLKPLEKATYKIEAKSKGLWGSGVYVVIPGSSSKVRLIPAQVQFIIHFDDARTDPSTLFDVVPLSVNQKNNNDQREYMLKSSGAGHSETNSLRTATTAKKVGDGLYLVTFDSPAETGEYAFTIEKTRQAYVFGVDSQK